MTAALGWAGTLIYIVPAVALAAAADDIAGSLSNIERQLHPGPLGDARSALAAELGTAQERVAALQALVARLRIDIG